MDVSNPRRSDSKVVQLEGPKGPQLIETLVSLTGLELPAEQKAVHAELGSMIHDAGHSPEALTLDQLREAMLAYLETIHLSYGDTQGESQGEGGSDKDKLAGPVLCPEKLKLVSE
jgi:hypothetical protein